MSNSKQNIQYSKKDINIDSSHYNTKSNMFDSILVFIYMETVYLGYIYDYSFIQTIYNICSLIAIARLIYFASKNGFRVNRTFAFFFALCITSGILCMLFTNNLSFEKVLDSGIMAIFVGTLIIRKPLNDKVFLISLYLNIAYFLMMFAINGLGQRVMAFHSNNYISVVLLYSLTTYYLVVLKNNSKILLHPAILGWVIALMARGRSGIICLTLLFIGVFIYVYFKQNENKKNIIRYYVRIIGFVVIMMVVS